MIAWTTKSSLPVTNTCNSGHIFFLFLLLLVLPSPLSFSLKRRRGGKQKSLSILVDSLLFSSSSQFFSGILNCNKSTNRLVDRFRYLFSLLPSLLSFLLPSLLSSFLLLPFFLLVFTGGGSLLYQKMLSADRRKIRETFTE